MLILGAGFHALAEVRRDAPVRAPLVLGLPGQKQRADGTWDNWYRTYLADVGRYLSPEPLLQSPVYVRRMAQSGVQVPTYAYAANNPLRYVDPDGRELTDLPFVMGIMMKNYLQMYLDNRKGGDKFWHCNAHCEASSLGPTTTTTAFAVSFGRELVDVPIWLSQGNSLSTTLQSSIDDQKANLCGILPTKPSCYERCAALFPGSAPEPWLYGWIR